MEKVEKKEKNADITLIISEEELKENQRRIYAREREQKIIRKKKERRMTIIRVVVFAILILIFGAMVYWGAWMKSTGYHNCIEQGHDQAYCLKNS